MSMNEVLQTIKSLARSQGCYGRMYNALMDCKENDPERYEQIKETLEAQKFLSPVDLVLYFEC